MTEYVIADATLHDALDVWATVAYRRHAADWEAFLADDVFRDSAHLQVVGIACTLDTDLMAESYAYLFQVRFAEENYRRAERIVAAWWDAQVAAVEPVAVGATVLILRGDDGRLQVGIDWGTVVDSLTESDDAHPLLVALATDDDATPDLVVITPIDA
jgi:hypothetical protein